MIPLLNNAERIDAVISEVLLLVFEFDSFSLGMTSSSLFEHI